MILQIKLSFIFISCLMIVICSIASAEQSGTIIVTSSPIDCELSFGQDIKNTKDLTVKGGVISNQTSTTLNINKVEFQVVIDGVPASVYPIIFKRGDILLKSEVNIQPGKVLLAKGNFNEREVFITPQVFIGKDGAPMVLIPAGEFLMGSDKGDPDEQPIHKVYIDELYMDVYEVTNAQYRKFIESTGHKSPKYWNDPKCSAPDQPVVGVTWQDAVDYCKWAGKRLPTEAEWEKAARGGLAGKEYPWGDEENIKAPGDQENPGLSSAFPVGCFLPNGYGLHDMERNVWEWCADWADDEYYSKSPDKNPQGPNSGTEKVLRGGSWSSGIYTPLRVAYRYRFDPLQPDILIGFRCVSQNDEPKNSGQLMPNYWH